ncbi:hypothetical protein HXX76_010865 [Chlamydomonas incerta]|uniref:Uncharacterized protein n=1 Tax=Chlamydomonas incerta TaxID=51695 RepID=A0A835SWP1_CHLIN|nr:hypothetical protein HXX76_010865 [Chlamydomonas incerta]|eukprot:KAG2429634.1 hypothetical protein HXX76_010865 [Chlamydomonas incerta]
MPSFLVTIHSSIRSKVQDDYRHGLLRAYAQAVGGNCGDPEQRHAALEAARREHRLAQQQARQQAGVRQNQRPQQQLQQQQESAKEKQGHSSEDGLMWEEDSIDEGSGTGGGGAVAAAGQPPAAASERHAASLLAACLRTGATAVAAAPRGIPSAAAAESSRRRDTVTPGTGTSAPSLCWARIEAGTETTAAAVDATKATDAAASTRVDGSCSSSSGFFAAGASTALAGQPAAPLFRASGSSLGPCLGGEVGRVSSISVSDCISAVQQWCPPPDAATWPQSAVVSPVAPAPPPTAAAWLTTSCPYLQQPLPHAPAAGPTMMVPGGAPTADPLQLGATAGSGMARTWSAPTSSRMLAAAATGVPGGGGDVAPNARALSSTPPGKVSRLHPAAAAAAAAAADGSAHLSAPQQRAMRSDFQGLLPPLPPLPQLSQLPQVWGYPQAQAPPAPQHRRDCLLPTFCSAPAFAAWPPPQPQPQHQAQHQPQPQPQPQPQHQHQAQHQPQPQPQPQSMPTWLRDAAMAPGIGSSGCGGGCGGSGMHTPTAPGHDSRALGLAGGTPGIPNGWMCGVAGACSAGTANGAPQHTMRHPAAFGGQPYAAAMPVPSDQAAAATVAAAAADAAIRAATQAAAAVWAAAAASMTAAAGAPPAHGGGGGDAAAASPAADLPGGAAAAASGAGTAPNGSGGEGAGVVARTSCGSAPVGPVVRHMLSLAREHGTPPRQQPSQQHHNHSQPQQPSQQQQHRCVPSLAAAAASVLPTYPQLAGYGGAAAAAASGCCAGAGDIHVSGDGSGGGSGGGGALGLWATPPHSPLCRGPFLWLDHSGPGPGAGQYGGGAFGQQQLQLQLQGAGAGTHLGSAAAPARDAEISRSMPAALPSAAAAMTLATAGGVGQRPGSAQFGAAPGVGTIWAGELRGGGMDRGSGPAGWRLDGGWGPQPEQPEALAGAAVAGGLGRGRVPSSGAAAPAAAEGCCLMALDDDEAGEDAALHAFLMEEFGEELQQ